MQTADLSTFFEEFVTRVMMVLPNLLLGLGVLIIGYFLGRIVQRISKKFILYLDGRMELRTRGGSRGDELRYAASVLPPVLFWVVFSVALLLCVYLLQLEFLDELLASAIRFLPHIVAAILILLAGIFFGRLLSNLVRAAARKSGVVTKNFIGSALRYFVLLVAIVIASDQLGIHTDFLTDVINIILAMLLFGATLAFGLGAKTSVSNILGSYYTRKDHRIGSRVQYAGKTGTILKISGHAVHLDTEAGIIVIPARQFTEQEVTIIREQND